MAPSVGAKTAATVQKMVQGYVQERTGGNVSLKIWPNVPSPTTVWVDEQIEFETSRTSTTMTVKMPPITIKGNVIHGLLCLGSGSTAKYRIQIWAQHTKINNQQVKEEAGSVLKPSATGSGRGQVPSVDG